MYPVFGNLPPAQVPQITTDPLYIGQKVNLLPVETRFIVFPKNREPYYLDRIYARYDWGDPPANGTIPRIKIAGISKPPNSNKSIMIDTVSSPANKKIWVYALAIGTAYFEQEGFEVIIDGYSGPFPTFVDFCFKGRKGLRYSAYNPYYGK